MSTMTIKLAGILGVGLAVLLLSGTAGAESVEAQGAMPSASEVGEQGRSSQRQ